MLFARGHGMLLGIHVQPSAHRNKTPRVLRARKPRHAHRCPFSANTIRRSKRSAIIHHRPAAQAFSRKKSHAVVVRPRKSPFAVKPLKSRKLPPIKIPAVVVIPRF